MHLLHGVQPVSVTFDKACDEGRDDGMSKFLRLKQFCSPTMGGLEVAFLIRALVCSKIGLKTMQMNNPVVSSFFLQFLLALSQCS